MYVAALDIGTTGCRTFIFDIQGNIVSNDYQEWNSFFPSPSHVEQDAKVWWSALQITIENALKKIKINKTDIISLSVTNQRETIVPVDKNGEPLYNALVWQDRRTTKQVEFINNKIGLDNIYKTTGLTIDHTFLPLKFYGLKIIYLQYTKKLINFY